MKKAHLKRIAKIILSPIYRIGLCSKNFTIISNNCWAGHYYDMFHLKYNTPTIGLYIPPKDYLRFIENLDYYLSLDVEQIDVTSSRAYPMLKRKEESGRGRPADTLIVGKIDDVEIIFLHYDSFEEARLKWDRRKNRINKNMIIFKFNDQNEFLDEDFSKFKEINLPHKLFFTSNPKYQNEENCYFIKKYSKTYGYAVDDMHHNGFNLKKYLRKMKGEN